MKPNETKGTRINPEYTGQILDVFEDYLTEKDVYIPNEQRAADGIDEDVRLYGKDYESLEAYLNDIVAAWNGTPEVFIPPKEIKYAEDDSKVAALLMPGECVAQIYIEGEYFPREIIIPIDSDDVAGALEETLHRLIDNGIDPAIMGVSKLSEDTDPDRWTYIDLDYGIEGHILSMDYTRTERVWLRDFPDYIGRHYNLNSDAMSFLNTFVNSWLTWQDDPYDRMKDELQMFMSDIDVDPRVYDMIEEFQGLED